MTATTPRISTKSNENELRASQEPNRPAHVQRRRMNQLRAAPLAKKIEVLTPAEQEELRKLKETWMQVFTEFSYVLELNHLTAEAGLLEAVKRRYNGITTFEKLQKLFPAKVKDPIRRPKANMSVKELADEVESLRHVCTSLKGCIEQRLNAPLSIGFRNSIYTPAKSYVSEKWEAFKEKITPNNPDQVIALCVITTVAFVLFEAFAHMKGMHNHRPHHPAPA